MTDSNARWMMTAGIGPLMLLGIAATSLAQGVTGYQSGQGGSPVQGAAGTNASVGDDGLQHCLKPMAAIAVVEPQDTTLQYLSRYSLSSPTSLIRMMIQQSNCFIVVERGVALQNMKQERALAGSGELRSNSNMGGGQMVGADFILTPNVIFSESDAGGIGAGIAGLVPGSRGGAEQNGFVHVQGGSAGGWVRKALLTRSE